MNGATLYLVPLSGLLGLAFSLYLAYSTLKNDPGTPEIVGISRAIQTGATAFMRREYRVMGLTALAFAVFLALVLDVYVMLTFLIGILCSALSSFVGINIATRSNGRVTFAARGGLSKALQVAFSGGAVMGMSVVSLSALGISGTYLLFDLLPFTPEPLSVMTGYSMGASFVAIFVRIGGGIFTKAADIGADLVGKVEVGIPEDDPRNGAVIADQVGDNVGDVAGLGSDLNQSYTDTIISSLIIGAAAQSVGGLYLGVKGIVFPLLTVANGIVASALAILTVILLVRMGRIQPETTFRVGLLISAFLALLGILFLSFFYLGYPGAFYATSAGLIVGVLIGLNTEYYTYGKPIRDIAAASETGAATNIIMGLAVGLESTVLSMILLGVGMIVAHHFAGLYGVALSGLGMLSMLGINLAMDAYGPIADNAGGIAQMSQQHPQIRHITDRLDAVGNTTAAIGKSFASSATAAAAISLLTAYSEAVNIVNLDIRDPRVMAGLLIGGVLPAFFSSVVIRSVGRTAQLMVVEVRRQFREIVGLLEGEVQPDYARCVDIATQGALGQLALPCVLAISIPFITILILGREALAGVLAGCIVCGIFLALFMANTGGAWDNAKKLIEEGEMGGRGSVAHKASVIGDTVGDPLKDTAGPTLDILVQLVATVSLAFAPLFLRVLG
ncbi:MAG: sodium-translocating pyrophosphatase [Chloroflexota bacterium]|nr:sodium-translocating pyrophosphatase [Chloroflexota bacterium]